MWLELITDVRFDKDKIFIIGIVQLPYRIATIIAIIFWELYMSKIENIINFNRSELKDLEEHLSMFERCADEASQPYVESDLSIIYNQEDRIFQIKLNARIPLGIILFEILVTYIIACVVK